MERCGWVSQDPLYIAYHDNEWGVPETDSRKTAWKGSRLGYRGSPSSKNAKTIAHAFISSIR